MIEPRISLVTLGVRDLAKSRAFYRALGWPEAGAVDDVAFYQLGPLAFGLFAWDSLAKDAKVSPQGEGFRGFSLAHNVRAKDEVDSCLAEAAVAGARILEPATDAPWGGRSGYFADPDGHLWEIAWNPGFPLAEDGSITVKL